MPDPETFWADEASNPGVNRKLLDQIAELRREVEKFGAGDQPGYRIAPALGGTVMRRGRGAADAGARSPFSAVLARVR
jgi:hypothetical protein